MAVTLVLGWGLTEYLGSIYKHNVQEKAWGDLDLIASRLAGETSTVDGVVKSLAGSPSVTDFLVDKQGGERAKFVLALDVEASGAKSGYLLDRSGAVVASSDSRKPNIDAPLATNAAYRFGYNRAGGEPEYSASSEVRDESGKPAGAAVLTKSLKGFEADLRRFDHPLFLISPDGIVFLTNRPNMMLRPLWPLSEEAHTALLHEFRGLNERPILKAKMADATWISFDGGHGFLRRLYADHSDWSLVTVTLPHNMFASRVLGIVITLMMTVVALVYLVGGERLVRDNVQLNKRLELEELARKLDFRATTDPLTGLFNRRKFNHELSLEISRSQRYRTPLSLIIFDIDHFKAINDAYGHQVGDKVLTALAKFVSGRIRKTDVLARWGGEEFMLLVPGSRIYMAAQLAEDLRNAMREFASGDAGMATSSFGVAEFEDGDTADSLSHARTRRFIAPRSTPEIVSRWLRFSQCPRRIFETQSISDCRGKAAASTLAWAAADCAQSCFETILPRDLFRSLYGIGEEKGHERRRGEAQRA
jgi:diguanylate cyclase (GGDEF)-like protein